MESLHYNNQCLQSNLDCNNGGLPSDLHINISQTHKPNCTHSHKLHTVIIPEKQRMMNLRVSQRKAPTFLFYNHLLYSWIKAFLALLVGRRGEKKIVVDDDPKNCCSNFFMWRIYVYILVGINLNHITLVIYMNQITRE